MLLTKEPSQQLLDKVLYEVLQQLLASDNFSEIIDDACLRVTGVSSFKMRTTVKMAFKDKVGM